MFVVSVFRKKLHRTTTGIYSWFVNLQYLLLELMSDEINGFRLGWALKKTPVYTTNGDCEGQKTNEKESFHAKTVKSNPLLFPRYIS